MAIEFPEVPAERAADTHDCPASAEAALRRFLDRCSRLVVLTGAGCSTDSGVPAYRDAEGTWRQRRPIEHAEFVASEAGRRRYWARSHRGWPLMDRARPNAAHHWLAELQAAGRISCLVTQNVDGLHQRAGSGDVVELHGSVHRVGCLDCGARYSRAHVQRRLETLNPSLAAAQVDLSAPIRPDGDADVDPAFVQDLVVPDCERCGGVLKPDVVFFGDSVPRERVDAVQQALERSDGLLVVGSSLMVFSGYRFCRAAAKLGLPMASITQGRTRADDLLDLRLRVAAAELAERMRGCEAPAG